MIQTLNMLDHNPAAQIYLQGVIVGNSRLAVDQEDAEMGLLTNTFIQHGEACLSWKVLRA